MTYDFLAEACHRFLFDAGLTPAIIGASGMRPLGFTFELASDQILFGPSKIVINQKLIQKKWELDYEDTIVAAKYATFATSDDTPSGAPIDCIRYEHTCVDGSPDLRYNSNRSTIFVKTPALLISSFESKTFAIPCRSLSEGNRFVLAIRDYGDGLLTTPHVPAPAELKQDVKSCCRSLFVPIAVQCKTLGLVGNAVRYIPDLLMQSYCRISAVDGEVNRTESTAFHELFRSIDTDRSRQAQPLQWMRCFTNTTRAILSNPFRVPFACELLAKYDGAKRKNHLPHLCELILRVCEYAAVADGPVVQVETDAVKEVRQVLRDFLIGANYPDPDTKYASGTKS